MDKLDALRVFCAVVEAGGFALAADRLGLSTTAVSRHVAQLETQLGVRLLHRTTRKLELTEAGQIYYERCKRIVAEAKLAHEQLGDLLAQPSGVLRVSLPVDFATTYLAPLIAEFARCYPGIRFDFDLTPRRVDLVAEPFDVAIRMGEPQDSGLIARPLASLPTYLYASPSYLASAGEPLQPADLSLHECLGFRTVKALVWALNCPTTQTDMQVEVGGRFQLNNVGMMRRLATLGLGIVLMNEAMVADELTSGRLQRVLPLWQGEPVPVYVITETRLLPAKTQRFIEFLRERLGQGLR